MHLMFHGTSLENAERILASGEFAVGTHFGHHMEECLKMGGACIFEVVFDEKPTDYWEYRCPEPIPTSQVRLLINVEPTVLWHNLNCEREVTKSMLLEMHDGVEFCEECDGRGQEEYYPPLTRWNEMQKVTACGKCNGHGVHTTDGSDIYEHKRT